MLYEVSSSPRRVAVEPLPPAAEGGVFTLVGCPPIGRGNFVLIKRDASGSTTLLAMGRLQQDCDTLNLAHIRRLGAELGANEVQVFPAGYARH